MRPSDPANAKALGGSAAKAIGGPQQALRAALKVYANAPSGYTPAQLVAHRASVRMLMIELGLDKTFTNMTEEDEE